MNERGGNMNDTFEKKGQGCCRRRLVGRPGGHRICDPHRLMYLAVMSYQPGWVLAMWGPGTTWPFAQNVWFWAVVGNQVFRLVIDVCGSLADVVG